MNSCVDSDGVNSPTDLLNGDNPHFKFSVCFSERKSKGLAKKPQFCT